MTAQFYLNIPDPRLSGDLYAAALLLFRFGIGLDGVVGIPGVTPLIGWKIYPVDKNNINGDMEVQLSILENGVWHPVGKFYAHEMSMAAIMEHMEIQIKNTQNRSKQHA